MLTGLSGKDLGKFMSDFINQFGDNWRVYVLTTDQQKIDDDIVGFFNK